MRTFTPGETVAAREDIARPGLPPIKRGTVGHVLAVRDTTTWQQRPQTSGDMLVKFYRAGVRTITQQEVIHA